MNHEKTHQTNPMAPWDPLDALLTPLDPLATPNRPPQTHKQVSWPHCALKITSTASQITFTFAPAPCFGRRTISFLVKFESSLLCTLLAYIGHLGYFIPHLMNNKADFGFKVLKKLTSKTEKMRKCPKTANFGHVLVYLSNQICFA